jgi:hypothetical protein
MEVEEFENLEKKIVLRPQQDLWVNLLKKWNEKLMIKNS